MTAEGTVGAPTCYYLYLGLFREYVSMDPTLSMIDKTSPYGFKINVDEEITKQGRDSPIFKNYAQLRIHRILNSDY